MSNNSPSLPSAERNRFSQEDDLEDEAKTAVMPKTLAALYDVLHQFQNIEATTTLRSPENEAAARVCALLERATDEAEILGPLLA
jgi:hypothetical protein